MPAGTYPFILNVEEKGGLGWFSDAAYIPIKKARKQSVSVRFYVLLPQIILYQHVQKLVPIQLADHGAGAHVIGDIGGIL